MCCTLHVQRAVARVCSVPLLADDALLSVRSAIAALRHDVDVFALLFHDAASDADCRTLAELTRLPEVRSVRSLWWTQDVLAMIPRSWRPYAKAPPTHFELSPLWQDLFWLAVRANATLEPSLHRDYDASATTVVLLRSGYVIDAAGFSPHWPQVALLTAATQTGLAVESILLGKWGNGHSLDVFVGLYSAALALFASWDQVDVSVCNLHAELLVRTAAFPLAQSGVTNGWFVHGPSCYLKLAESVGVAILVSSTIESAVRALTPSDPGAAVIEHESTDPTGGRYAVLISGHLRLWRLGLLSLEERVHKVTEGGIHVFLHVYYSPASFADLALLRDLRQHPLVKAFVAEVYSERIEQQMVLDLPDLANHSYTSLSYIPQARKLALANRLRANFGTKYNISYAGALRYRPDLFFGIDVPLHMYVRPKTLAYAGCLLGHLPTMDLFAAGPIDVMDVYANQYFEFRACHDLLPEPEVTKWDRRWYATIEHCTDVLVQSVHGYDMWEVPEWQATIRRGQCRGVFYDVLPAQKRPLATHFLPDRWSAAGKSSWPARTDCGVPRVCGPQ